MMLYGKKIKVLAVLLLVVSFLLLACCNKKSVEKEKTTEEETNKRITTTIEKDEEAICNTTEKETIPTKETTVITIVANNGGDNQIAFDFSEEKESLNIYSTTSATDETARNHQTINKFTTQQPQTATQPATDSNGWVTKWY